jgi:tRNA pseudouridine38-40 synthase
MPRFAFLVEYHGGPFHGWQWQEGRPSVQAAFEAALAKLDPAAPRVAAAGRTDAGVHATGQVAHADLARDWEPARLREAINWHLRPLPVAVVAVAEVDPGFHARFTATGRRYLYRIVTRPAPVVHDRGLVWRRPQPLDIDAMRAGARHLLGQHDFTTFRASICQAASPVKTLDEIAVTEHPYPGGAEIRLAFAARSFLHNQVRSMVGTLERVGAGAWPPVRVAAALAARDRTECGPVAPAEGLYLVGVDYPQDPFAGAGAGESVGSDARARAGGMEGS